MSKAQNSSIRIGFRSLLGCVILAMVSAPAFAVKPGTPVVYTDVSITYAGQTFGFAGRQESFNLAQDGGSVVFDLTSLSSPEFTPLPEVDVGSLQPNGNSWKIVSKVNSKSWTYAGTCASESFTTSNGDGSITRHLYLNCRDLSF